MRKDEVGKLQRNLQAWSTMDVRKHNDSKFLGTGAHGPQW
jgi:hypothetical protein